METFSKKLASLTNGDLNRRWILVLEDQLSDEIGPLSREDPHQLGIVVIESHWRAKRRPYHKHKIAFHFLNLRQFALEQAQRGIAIRYLITTQSFRSTLKPLIQELGVVRLMEPAEFEIRRDIEPLVKRGLINIFPHEGWLTCKQDFWQGAGRQPPWRMDNFYRYVRQKTGVLMKGPKPLGGKYSFDAQNRKPWKGTPTAPQIPSFQTDPIKDEVIRMVQETFGDHPGHIHSEFLPGTKQDARDLWEWAKRSCLPVFGPYEDAMAEEERGLFHTRISSLLNVHRLLPCRVVQEVESLKLSLPSKEGFIRQVLGWREFVYHVHRETHGFRKKTNKLKKPGDAGFKKWINPHWKTSKNITPLDGGAKPSYLGSKNPLPPAFWGGASGLNCLDRVIESVWEESYSHHITRLMVLSNIATLLDVSPRDLTDWFWVAYTDAFDWVVEPNVLAMGTFGTGPLMTTKPYVCGAAYINRMSNYCSQCAFNPKTNCPITPLYWAFLHRHRSKLETNPRLRLPFQNLKKRGQDKTRIDMKIYKIVNNNLAENKHLMPQIVEDALNVSKKKRKEIRRGEF